MTEQTEKLSEPARFYRLVQKVTARLVGAQGEGIDAAIQDCLARMGEHFGVDNVSLGAISTAGDLIPSVPMWSRVPSSRKVVAVDPPPGPEMVAEFRREGSFVYSRLEDLAGYPQFREHTRRFGVVAAVFWMHRDWGSHVEGMAISTGKPKIWPDDTLEHLGVVGEALFNALYRRRAEIDAERLRRFEQVVADVASKFVHVSPERVDGEIETTLGRVCECVDADLKIYDDGDSRMGRRFHRRASLSRYRSLRRLSVAGRATERSDTSADFQSGRFPSRSGE
jgi:hypothetical protein